VRTANQGWFFHYFYENMGENIGKNIGGNMGKEPQLLLAKTRKKR
jgi:hypothetical protein